MLLEIGKMALFLQLRTQVYLVQMLYIDPSANEIPQIYCLILRYIEFKKPRKNTVIQSKWLDPKERENEIIRRVRLKCVKRAAKKGTRYSGRSA